MTEVLADRFSVRDRFQRSTRIDSQDQDELDGFILHETGKQIIVRLLQQIGSGEQRAFTWTGPYGSGKSTLGLFLANVLGNDEEKKTKAIDTIGKRSFNQIAKSSGAMSAGWLVLKVSAQKSDVESNILRNIDREIEEFWPSKKAKVVKKHIGADLEKIDLVGLLISLSKCVNEETGGGLFIIIDELGIFYIFYNKIKGEELQLRRVSE